MPTSLWCALILEAQNRNNLVTALMVPCTSLCSDGFGDQPGECNVIYDQTQTAEGQKLLFYYQSSTGYRFFLLLLQAFNGRATEPA